jgi:MFS family permease
MSSAPLDPSDDSHPLLDDGAAAVEMEEAFEEGDRPFQSGTVRSLFAYRDFRLAFSGAVFSNIGTWMQNIVLAAYAWELTGSASFVGVMTFATLGPQFFFAMIGGALADTYDRRIVVTVCSVAQMVLVFALAALVATDEPSRAALLGMVFVIGIASALVAPAFTSLLPGLVPAEEIQGAVSLAAANMNLSRVVGPALGGILFALVGASWVFVVNGFSYLFMIVGVLAVRTRPRPSVAAQLPPLKRVASGFGIVWRDPVLRRAVSSIAIYSIFGLGFLTQLPVVSSENLGIPADSIGYGLLYATLASGSLVGALAVGFLMNGRSLESLVRISLVAFALVTVVLAVISGPVAAYPVTFVVGLTYFVATTSMVTVVQRRVADHERGRVLAVWMMALAGTLPLGSVIAGALVEATTVTAALLVAAACSLLLVAYADLRDRTGDVGGATPAIT